MHFTSAFRARIARFGERDAILTFDGQRVSFAKLLQTIDTLAAHLVKHGVKPGDRVFAATDNRELQTFLRLATLLVRADAVFLPEYDLATRIGLEVEHVIAFADQKITHPGLIVFDPVWLAPPLPLPEQPPGNGRMIFASSGSTGMMKLMAANDKIFHSWWSLLDQGAGAALGNALVTLPPFSGFGLCFVMRSLMAGQGVMGTMGDVETTLKHACDFDVREVLATPMILADLVALAEAGKQVPALERLVYGGAIADSDLLRRAQAAFPNTEFAVVFGATEVGPMGYGVPDLATVPDGWGGAMFDGVRYALRGQETYGSLGNQAGRLTVFPPEAFRLEGYLGGGEPIYDVEGGFETGDIVLPAGQHDLVFLGREDFLINLGGAKYAPEMIEMSCADCPGLEGIAALGLHDGPKARLGLAVVTGPEFDPKLLRAQLQSRTGIRHEIVLRHIGGLPRVANGKLDRNALPALFS